MDLGFRALYSAWLKQNCICNGKRAKSAASPLNDVPGSSNDVSPAASAVASSPARRSFSASTSVSTSSGSTSSTSSKSHATPPVSVAVITFAVDRRRFDVDIRSFQSMGGASSGVSLMKPFKH
ncbi:hypothetical protein ACHAWC_007904 [Mediolabrus comicus]